MTKRRLATMEAHHFVLLLLALCPALASAFSSFVPSLALSHNQFSHNVLPRSLRNAAGSAVMVADSDVKTAYLSALKEAGGEPTDEKAFALMEELCSTYAGISKSVVEEHSGKWLTLSNYFGPQGLGKNEAGDNIYELGRMSFNMFKPKDLKCSLQPITNDVQLVDTLPDFIPKGLEEDVKKGELMSYNVEVPYTVEDERGNGLQGKMSTIGYALPDPEEPNRLTVFFTGGLNQPANTEDVGAWKVEFEAAQERVGFRDKLFGWVGGAMMGLDAARQINEQGVAEYSFQKPIGGHGKAYLDVLYLDDTLRITRGNRGSYVVAERVE